MAKKSKKDLKKAKKIARKMGMTKPHVVIPIAAPGLGLGHLRVANVARSEDPKGFDHPLTAWSILEWCGAFAGEVGEAANVAKKILRIRKGTRGNVKKDDKDEKKLLKKFAKEIADAVCYADLTLASEGISLSDTIIKVYNDKSKQIGYDFLL